MENESNNKNRLGLGMVVHTFTYIPSTYGMEVGGS